MICYLLTIKMLHNIRKIGDSCHTFYFDEKPIRVRLVLESHYMFTKSIEKKKI